jgi:hypothetical protein
LCGRRVSGERLLTLDGIVASTVIGGSMTHDKFLHFLEHSVLSAVVVPSHHNFPLTALLDASHITILRKVECFGDGQHMHSPWG